VAATKFTLSHTNAVETAALDGGAWQPSLPLSNLVMLPLTRRTRSINAQ
jgi:hypothetical protein